MTITSAPAQRLRRAPTEGACVLLQTEVTI